MLDTPGHDPDMSDKRATEIVSFIEDGTETRFCNIRSLPGLEQLAARAYKALNTHPPANLGNLLKNASYRLEQQKRLGLDIGSRRARHLVDHLFGKEDNPYFRKDDGIEKQRELLRKALATVALTEEKNSENTRHPLIVKGNDLIEQQYPLN